MCSLEVFSLNKVQCRDQDCHCVQGLEGLSALVMGSGSPQTSAGFSLVVGRPSRVKFHAR
jgi:hypothetical protein